jgi:hypothetical protein
MINSAFNLQEASKPAKQRSDGRWKAPNRRVTLPYKICLKKGIRPMIKTILGVLVGLAFSFITHAALAQTTEQCGQVRAAVAQYGYKAAKAHADATLSPDQVRAASTCLNRRPLAKKRDSARQRGIR